MPAIVERIAALLPSDVPDEAGVGYVAELFGITAGAVNAAIRNGKLPARVLRSSNGKGSYIVTVSDAVMIWGYRLAAKNSIDVPFEAANSKT